MKEKREKTKEEKGEKRDGKEGSDSKLSWLKLMIECGEWKEGNQEWSWLTCLLSL